MMAQLNLSISNFQGPFDVLLHLIQKNEMEIYNINLSEITSQYLSFLSKMRELDLEVTSEFIVIAATLMEIKSKELLPKAVKEEEEEDQGDLLKKKLIEYKKIKAAVEYLKGIKQYSGTVYTKKAEVIEDKDVSHDIFINISMMDLYNIFEKLMDNFFNKQNKDSLISDKINVDIFRIEDKYREISELIKVNRHIKFSKLMEECSCKLEIVVTFLALLELSKQKIVSIKQNDNFSSITIERITDKTDG